MRLTSDFFDHSTIQVAKNFLGTFLVHDSPQGKTMGRIVETEAYLSDDAACHASRGETKRNKVMFGPPGHAYIYFIYGMYYCLNVVTADKGIGEAVLIRAIEPVEGIELMKKRRPKVSSLHQLCNGPAKLVLAMGIPYSLNGVSFSKGPLKILLGDQLLKNQIVTTTRIGISQAAHLPLRFYIKDNSFISKR